MPKLLILTGPQGSGNHLFSKIFAQHPAVNSWTALNNAVWVGHDQEPFAELWRNPDLIKTFDWSTHDFHVTSISCPYRDNGSDAYPLYECFIQTAIDHGIDVQVAVIGRDQNILAYQEQRLRDRVTYTEFQKYLPILQKYNPVFLSQELAYLYKDDYLHQLRRLLEIPIQYNADIFADDANRKYLQPVESNWLDTHIRRASKQ